MWIKSHWCSFYSAHFSWCSEQDSDSSNEDETSPGISFSELILIPKKSVTIQCLVEKLPSIAAIFFSTRSLFLHSKLKSSEKCGKNENSELQKKKPQAANPKLLKIPSQKIWVKSLFGINLNKITGTALCFKEKRKRY